MTMNKKSNFKGVAHTKESKECLVCGRLFYNNKSYISRGIWSEVKYCSDKCRREKNKIKLETKKILSPTLSKGKGVSV
jgi:hypothetical protein